MSTRADRSTMQELPSALSGLLLALPAWARTPGLSDEAGPVGQSPERAGDRIIQRPESKDWLLRPGAEPAPRTPEQLAERIRTDLERLNTLLRDNRLKLN